MKIFKFSGIIHKLPYLQRERDRNYSGYFIQHEHDEIIGILYHEDKKSFIKGLFINYVQLIFVEITVPKHKETNHSINGYSFKDIHQKGYFDMQDWLSGLFSGEVEQNETTIQVYVETDSNNMTKKIEQEFKEFYQTLDDWENFYFRCVQELREFI